MTVVVTPEGSARVLAPVRVGRILPTYALTHHLQAPEQGLRRVGIGKINGSYATLYARPGLGYLAVRVAFRVRWEAIRLRREVGEAAQAITQAVRRWWREQLGYA